LLRRYHRYHIGPWQIIRRIICQLSNDRDGPSGIMELPILGWFHIAISVEIPANEQYFSAKDDRRLTPNPEPVPA
jgi:hypothetical protein